MRLLGTDRGHRAPRACRVDLRAPEGAECPSAAPAPFAGCRPDL